MTKPPPDLADPFALIEYLNQAAEQLRQQSASLSRDGSRVGTGPHVEVEMSQSGALERITVTDDRIPQSALAGEARELWSQLSEQASSDSRAQLAALGIEIDPAYLPKDAAR